MLPSDTAGTSQKLPSFLTAGRRVRVRGTLWRIRYVQPFESCSIVHLAGAARDNAGTHRTLLHPFDRLLPEHGPTVLRVVTRRRWLHALRHALADNHPFDGLRAAAFARIDLLPFQLEPALLVARGLACRILLADEVGLGKTVQAGLLLAELRERGLAGRVLILTPSGLRRQWRDELRDRFGIEPVLVDSLLLRRRASSLPPTANPWLLDEVTIASIDLVKRREVLRGLAGIVWDLVVVDEAHGAAHATERLAAVEALARHARRVVLLTATPHAGDAEAFATLCRIGQHDEGGSQDPPLPEGISAVDDPAAPSAGGRGGSSDPPFSQAPPGPIALFRRTREQVGLPVRRRVRTLPVRLEPEEIRLHGLLARYAETVLEYPAARRDSVLAMVVLIKRSASDPASLRISIDRRRRFLSLQPAPGEDVQQRLTLTAAGEEEEADDRDAEPFGVLAVPGLSDRSRELAMLDEIASAARAAGVGRKARVLLRLLARIREPAVVFTEYRDTLQHLAALLNPGPRPRGDLTEAGSSGTAGDCPLAIIHGGLSEIERIRAREAFTGGSARILLATDAAGEGLNLHTCCRLVINLELPWSPTRLEQRIGRVERLGQTRTVHAITLFAGETAERSVLARLLARLDQARHDLGGVRDPLGLPHGLDLDHRSRSHTDDRRPSDVTWQPDLRAAAIAEAARLRSLRRIGARRANGPEEAAALITGVPGRRVIGLDVRPCVIWLMRALLLDGNGQLIEPMLVPLVDAVASVHAGVRPSALRPALQHAFETARSVLEARARAFAEARRRVIQPAHQQAARGALLREVALHTDTVLGADDDLVQLFQAGLFDARAVHQREAAARRRALALSAAAERRTQIEAAGLIEPASEPELALVLVVSRR